MVNCVTSRCSLGSMVDPTLLEDAEAMRQAHSDDREAVRTVLVDKGGDAVPSSIAAGPSIDETGEASFPASDPPASWTWDVAGRPPGPASG